MNSGKTWEKGVVKIQFYEKRIFSDGDLEVSLKTGEGGGVFL